METPILELIPEKTFIEVFREFNLQDAIENNHCQKTKYKYDNFVDNFSAFLAHERMDGLLISQMKIRILKGFVLWLPTYLRSCSKTHLAKHVQRINKALDYAVVMEYAELNPCSAYKIKRDKNKAVVSLDDQEFNIWVNASWNTKVYQDAQDDWIFSMVTGLSYMDLFTYKTSFDESTGIWIEGTRGKGGKPYFIPLYHKDFELARKIHEKHNGKLPFIENHFYNRLIREMAAMLGIDKYLTSHIGRKTFATLKDGGGMSMPIISTMLGNTENVCRTNYVAHINSKKKIAEELRRLA